MKVWITKYALTQGIYTVEVHEIDGDMLMVEDGPGRLAYYHGPAWWESEQLARADAGRRRIKKIASLKKQLAKMRAMTFRSEP